MVIFFYRRSTYPCVRRAWLLVLETDQCSLLGFWLIPMPEWASPPRVPRGPSSSPLRLLETIKSLLAKSVEWAKSEVPDFFSGKWRGFQTVSNIMFHFRYQPNRLFAMFFLSTQKKGDGFEITKVPKNHWPGVYRNYNRTVGKRKAWKREQWNVVCRNILKTFCFHPASRMKYFCFVEKLIRWKSESNSAKC